MAITPRSFRLNPRLVIVAALAALGIWSVLQMPSAPPAMYAMAPGFGNCHASTTPTTAWTVQQWGTTISCLLEADRGDDAYRAASMAVATHPANAALLNLRGFVAARNGDHATAIYDFRTGERITGSPDGVFENNIAWTTLFELEGLSAERTERVLLQTRALVDRSLQKGWSCERVHTALFVEYAIADLVAGEQGSEHPSARAAFARYAELYQQYAPCVARAAHGDELVLEELLSAAAMDVEMGRLAGIKSPIRHLNYARVAMERAAEIDVDVDRAWCARTTPVESAITTCAAF